MEGLYVIIADLENNPRKWFMDLIGSYDKDYIDLIRIMMRYQEIEDTFENYLLILPDGRYSEYTHGGGSSGWTPDPPRETGKKLDAKVGKAVSDLFGRHWRNIHPYNSILVVDQRFEEAALEALIKTGIMPLTYRDRRDPSLLDRILNLL